MKLSFFKKISSLFFIAFIFFYFNDVSYSQDAKKTQKENIEKNIKLKKNQLYEIKKKLQYQKYRLQIINDREDDLANQLSVTHNRLKINEDRLQQARVDILVNQQKIKITKEQLDYTVTLLNNKKDEMMLRLRDIYENETINYLSVLLKAETFTDFLIRFEFLSLIVRTDTQILNNYKKNEELFRVKKANFENAVKEKLYLKEILKEREKDLIVIKHKRQNLLNEVIAQRKELQGYVIELEGSTHELERQIISLIKLKQSLNIERKITSQYGGTGTYIWPCNSRYITSGFG